MARKWHDAKYGNWYVDNGTDERFEVCLDGRLFRIVEPNDYIVKTYWPPLTYHKEHILEIRTFTDKNVIEKCSFRYPYPNVNSIPSINGQSNLAYDDRSKTLSRCHFIYNIRKARSYQVIEVTYSDSGYGGVKILKNLPSEHFFFVRVNGVYQSINDVPKSVEHDYHTARIEFLIGV